jgi:hypothetical protein
MEVSDQQLEEVLRGKAVELLHGDKGIVLLAVRKEMYEKALSILQAEGVLQAEDVDPSFFECEEIEP